MKIRSITGFVHVGPDNASSQLQAIAAVLSEARKLLNAAGYEVQTLRIALPSFWIWSAAFEDPIETVYEIERHAERLGIDYVSIGPLPERGTVNFSHAVQILEKTKRIFTSVAMTDSNGELMREMLPEIAQTICDLGKLPLESFATLRFCVSACCQPNIPFFPAAYAQPNEFAFALAMECADMALTAAKASKSIEETQYRLTTAIEEHSLKFEQLFAPLEKNACSTFHGCDWSLAPYPDEACSMVAAIETMTGTTFGQFGSLTAVAALTRAVKAARVKHIGFSGAFLPVLEDSRLARRVKEGQVDLNRLLLYSTVCGSGLDTIPLADDVSALSIAAILSDLGTLAQVHEKPLTARFMPVAGLKAGQTTQFDFPYLVNAKSMELAPGASIEFFRERP